MGTDYRCVMNEYFSRSEVSPIDRAASRAPVAVPVVQPVATAARSADRDGAPVPAHTKPVAERLAKTQDETAGAAEYARVHARIADILADLRSGNSALTVDDAAGAISAMLPSPIILVPLPPASKEAVEHAARLAKRIAEQAHFALGAQAHVRRGAADRLLSAAP